MKSINNLSGRRVLVFSLVFGAILSACTVYNKLNNSNMDYKDFHSSYAIDFYLDDANKRDPFAYLTSLNDNYTYIGKEDNSYTYGNITDFNDAFDTYFSYISSDRIAYISENEMEEKYIDVTSEKESVSIKITFLYNQNDETLTIAYNYVPIEGLDFISSVQSKYKNNRYSFEFGMSSLLCDFLKQGKIERKQYDPNMDMTYTSITFYVKTEEIEKSLTTPTKELSDTSNMDFVVFRLRIYNGVINKLNLVEGDDVLSYITSNNRHTFVFEHVTRIPSDIMKNADLFYKIIDLVNECNATRFYFKTY